MAKRSRSGEEAGSVNRYNHVQKGLGQNGGNKMSIMWRKAEFRTKPGRRNIWNLQTRAVGRPFL